MTNIDCPDCGRRVGLSQSGIIPHHDNGSPIVCAGSGRLATAVERRATCEWCNSPATCIATSEDDPYQFACDEHCGHGSEEGSHAMLSDPSELLALVNGLRKRRANEVNAAYAEGTAEEREACAKIADGEAQRARALSERCEDTSDGFAFRGDVATAESIAYAIRARSKGGA